jgi:hypothetical protein
LEPLYERIEVCRDAETLWGKLNSGGWDWLGVKPDGVFVLGGPPVARTGVGPIGIIVSSAEAHTVEAA